MKIELNDQMLTAYALGELTEAEAEAVECLLAEAARAGNTAARDSLAEIRAAAALATESFANEPAVEGLRPEQVKALLPLLSPPRSRIWPTIRKASLFAGPLAAALLVIALYRTIDGLEPRALEVASRPPARAVSTDPPPFPASPPVPRTGYTPEQTVSGELRQNALLSRSWQSGTDASNAARSTPNAEELRALGYLTDSDGAAPSVSEFRGSRAASAQREQQRISTRSIPFFRYETSTQPPVASPGTEAYNPIVERGFTRVADELLSTFSIDVDTASYANVRRFLQQGQLPPPDAVRVEEMINYFDYAYGQPEGNTPFAAHFEMAACPWEPRHTLVRVGLKGREIPRAERPATNLVFLIDVSGSMQPANKLPLAKWAMGQLARQLDERDRVAIVTYASGVSVPLQSTNAANQQVILNAISALGAGGSTSGAAGIQTAYQVARQNFLPGGVNRVILATDGDFNVGMTDNTALEQLIQAEARTGVFLSVYGYGMGNLKDDRLEMLANKGNGTYGYIDSEAEARREFVEKLSGTLVTIAKDVKIQVEFNPARVGAYRLIGYENRALAAQDFNDDRKDAGEIGAGHTVTALYEVVPAGQPVPAGGAGVDPLRYQTAQPSVQVEAARVAPESHPAHAEELLLVKLRYKEPEGHESKLLEFPLTDAPLSPEQTSGDFKFASAVAAFGKLLRGNPLGANLSYDGMMQLAQAGLANSNDPHRSEMITLMLQARPMIESRGTMTHGPEAFTGAEIQLLRISEFSPGRYRAQIRTPSRTGWYQSGDAFESYELLNIDPIAGCVDIYFEQSQRTVRVCLQFVH